MTGHSDSDNLIPAYRRWEVFWFGIIYINLLFQFTSDFVKLSWHTIFILNRFRLNLRVMCVKKLNSHHALMQATASQEKSSTDLWVVCKACIVVSFKLPIQLTFGKRQHLHSVTFMSLWGTSQSLSLCLTTVHSQFMPLCHWPEYRIWSVWSIGFFEISSKISQFCQVALMILFLNYIIARLNFDFCHTNKSHSLFCFFLHVTVSHLAQ